jgi:hypothetical protein
LAIWWTVVEGDATTVSRRMRQTQVFVPRRCLLPDAREGGGWRYSGGAELRVLNDGIDFLWDWTNQELRELRHAKTERTKERRGSEAHRRQWIWPKEFAGLRISDDELRRLEMILRESRKGGRGRAPGGIYGWPWRA